MRPRSPIVVVTVIVDVAVSHVDVVEFGTLPPLLDGGDDALVLMDASTADGGSEMISMQLVVSTGPSALVHSG